MTFEDAKNLNKGDYVVYNNTKYKVMHVKENRNTHTNKPYASVKCNKGNEVIWFGHQFIEKCDI